MGCIVVWFLIEESNKARHTARLRCTERGARDTFIPDKNWQEPQPWPPEESLPLITVSWLHLFVPGCHHFRNCYAQHVRSHPFNWLAGPGCPEAHHNRKPSSTAYAEADIFDNTVLSHYSVPGLLPFLEPIIFIWSQTTLSLAACFLCITKCSYTKIRLHLRLCDGDGPDHFYFWFWVVASSTCQWSVDFFSRKRWLLSKLAFIDCYIQKLAKSLFFILFWLFDIDFILLLFFD